jgi:predicted alpha/beta-fold hydrolase
MASYFHRKGWDSVAWNCRGCSGEMNRLPRFYHHGATEDLTAVVDHAIQKKYKHISLVGFSMGGGEIAKYFSEFGGANVSKVVLISTVLPFMLQTSDNEDGVPQKVFDGMAEGLKNDRPAFLENFDDTNSA